VDGADLDPLDLEELVDEWACGDAEDPATASRAATASSIVG